MREKIAEIIRNNQNGDTDWDEMLDQLCGLYIVIGSSEITISKQEYEQLKNDSDNLSKVSFSM